MNRHHSAVALAIAASLALVGCSADADAPEDALAPTSEAAATGEPTTTPAPTEDQDPAPKPTEEVTEDSEVSTEASVPLPADYEIADEARTNGFEGVVAQYGADAVFAAVVRMDAPIVINPSTIPTDVLAEAATDACGLLDQGMTFDEVFMDGLDEMPEDNADNDLANFAWTMILVSVDTHCPQHAEARDAWYASGH